MQIVSNISYINPDFLITCDFESNSEPRKILSQKLSALQTTHGENCIILLALRCAGRRVISKNNCNLLNGRRHRIYYGAQLGKKQKIVFTWHKIKHLSASELNFMQNNWHEDFFEADKSINGKNINGKFLIKQSAGTNLHHLLYLINPTLF